MNDTFGIYFGEVSTWRGIVALLTLLGVHLDPEQADAIIQLGLAGYAFLAIFWKRKHPSMFE